MPHWIDLSKDTCRMFSQYYSESGSILFPTQSTIAYSNEYNYYYNNKVLLLETDIQTNFFLSNVKRRSGVITKLNIKLQPNKTYILRYKVMALSGFISGKYENGNHLRVHLRQNGDANNWDNQNNNQKLNDVCNFFEDLNTNDLAKWVQKECEFTVSSNLDKLEHIVFVVEDGRIAIDDIELFEKCPTEIAIQNKQYGFNTPGHVTKEQASEILYAGRNVTGNWSQGDVIVQNNADVHFTAGQKIVIGQGFKTELGAKFIAEIAPCSNSSNQRINNNDNINEEDELENNPNDSFIDIYPNPTNSTITIETPEITETTTLQIYNLYGQLMLQQQITSTQTQVDLSTFGKGLYVMQISDEQNNVSTHKILVQ